MNYSLHTLYIVYFSCVEYKNVIICMYYAVGPEYFRSVFVVGSTPLGRLYKAELANVGTEGLKISVVCLDKTKTHDC